MNTRTILIVAAAALAAGVAPRPAVSAAGRSPPAAAPASAQSTGAAARFPQPVRVGDLIGRNVLQPVEAQPVLGRVEAIVQQPDGALELVMRRGGVFGIGARLVAVPLGTAALLGEYVAMMDLTPAQLDALPTAMPGPPLPPDATVRMGLVRPFH